MPYTPTNWQTGDLITAGKLNNLEQGIAALYPQETIIAPEQTVTITSETDPETGVPITLAEGVDVSTFSEADLRGLSVSINGEAVTFDVGRWSIDVDGGLVLVRPVVDPDALSLVVLGFSLIAGNPETQAVLPGDYTVEIMRTVAEIPMLRAFPVVAGETSSEPWVVDAPVAEVDAAMTAGCVLLYVAAPSNRNGFAFGIIVSGIAYYATLTNSSFGWSAAFVRLVDGKYAITAFV